jgi:exodeoxyribonuclease VII large subunit
LAEVINNKKVFSLLEVSRSIQKTIADRYTSSFWVKAEMNKLNFYQHSGHCYPDLVEKQDGKVVAQLRANLWKDDYLRINSDFERVLKEPLKDGVKILILATVAFHPEHGLALRIIDIDPAFTLGDLEKEKLETIERLQREGILASNKQLKLPPLPQRIALISVETSKGYADFLKVLQAANRNWGYAFFHFLFPSLLQGDNAVADLIRQLRRIRQVIHHFDAVAIVRGGGGDIGLSCYNNYNLAREIALFPVPVITGIGHATNETVAELVAFENAITPTQLADFLVQKFHNFSVPLKKSEEQIASLSLGILEDASVQFASEVKLLRSVVKSAVGHHKNQTAMIVQSLSQHARFRIHDEKRSLTAQSDSIRGHATRMMTANDQRVLQLVTALRKGITGQLREKSLTLAAVEQNLYNLSPAGVMKRGYSITHKNGKLVRSAADIEGGDTITTILADGTAASTVQSVNRESNE